ncbi:STI1-like protein [Durusdinium trenchii]|uniref:STI1-like protein n=1 Tax=Durusdinium trenchii TaxID=1381693 RepID=A0ABP0PNZ2_9DINO
MAAWHRPWESARDRSAFALGFGPALVTDVFMELSRTFLLALQQGLVENPPAYSSEATIRPGDLYYLHQLLHSFHDRAMQVVAALGAKAEGLLFANWRATAMLLGLLMVVHMTFASAYTQLAAGENLGDLVAREGDWRHCQSNTIVNLELLDTPYARPPDVEAEDSNGTEVNTGSARLRTMMNRVYDYANPRPSYEIAVGDQAVAWLAVSSKLRSVVVKTKKVQVSVDEPTLFGPSWARKILKNFGLYDMYVLHALPSYFWNRCPGALRVRVLRGSSGPSQVLSLLSAEKRIHAFHLPEEQYRRNTWWVSGETFLVVLCGLLVAIVFSSFLRSFLVLSCRMYVNHQFCLRHLRRFAFIAQEMRRVNRAPSTVLLELWVAWSASAVLLLWLLAEAVKRSWAWPCWMGCYAMTEFWGLAHVRTLQSRWTFPRAALILNAGPLAYVYWWPYGCKWLLVWLVISSHISLGFYLLLHFDYCFSLNPEPPHQLYVSSLLLPAVHLSRHRESAAPRPVPKRPDARGAPVPRGEEVLETGEQRVTGDVSRGSAPVGATERRPEGMLDLDEID